jgi:hypothetical protein
MASFECIGFISNIKYQEDSVIMLLDEYHKGYRKHDGTTVDDKYVTYKTIWKQYFKKYIFQHFSEGMLVQVKGEMLPYAIEHNEKVGGYSILGQVVNMFSYPRASARNEMKMIKESQMNDTSTPNLEDYNTPDF